MPYDQSEADQKLHTQDLMTVSGDLERITRSITIATSNAGMAQRSCFTNEISAAMQDLINHLAHAQKMVNAAYEVNGEAIATNRRQRSERVAS